MNALPRSSVLVAALALAFACSSPPSGAGAGDVSLTDLGFTGSKLDGTGDTGAKDSNSPPSDAKVDPASCPFPANPASGEAGAACKVAGDCQSGFCVESADGKICSRGCVDCCPGGMTCTQLANGADFALVCVPQMLALCRPCATDAECAAVDKGALCIDRGDNDLGNIGKYCGGGCADASDCPGGYSCKTVQGEKGAGTQCVPDSGECTCGKTAILAGATTTCKTTNDLGTCAGSRKCALDGLTLCDAPSPTAEVCNGKDDNCDGATDELGAVGCKLYFGDGDDDGFGGGTGACLCAPDLAHAHSQGADCDDATAAIHPGAAELCNGKDDNCDGKTDEPGAQGCKSYFADADHDGFGAGAGACQCAADLAFPVTSSNDCNDASVAISPAASETCNQIDDNCNGVTDEGGVSCVVFYVDADSDGYGSSDGACLCQPDAIHTATKNGDCDDDAPNVHPKGVEICNGVDDNCNGLTDEGAATGCTVFFVDGDGDKFGGGTGACQCAADATYTTAKGGDCNDGDKSINPKVDETCNGKDDNCDGLTDEVGAEGCISYFVDSDGDGFGGDALAPKCQCAAAGVYAALVAGDCLDSNKTVYPGAPESCDTLDNNCDGIVDPVNALGCQVHYWDGDGDGYGTSVSECSCGADGSYSAVLNGDCDDGAATIHPGAAEVCNGKDDDCNGLTDEGVAGGTFYLDSDGDGYGDAGKSSSACLAPSGYVASGSDCNDADGAIHPGATEICDNVDNNCNGQTDEGTIAQVYYQDADGDGFGNANSAKLSCSAIGGYVTTGTDCDDTKSAVHPGAPEVCDGLDNNCDGKTDENLGATVYFQDSDGDSYGNPSVTLSACAQPAGYVTDNTDCNDANSKVNPCAFCIPFFSCGKCGWGQEQPSPIGSGCNGIDNNCNGYTDEGTAWPWYLDADGDGYGTNAVSKSVCIGNVLSEYSRDGSDCNDADKAIHPNATETFCDGIDQDCIGGDYCGATCQATTLYDFTYGPNGWSTGGGWTWDYYTALFSSSMKRLAYEKDKQTGYDATASASTGITLNVPNAAKFLQLSLTFANSTAYDSNATPTNTPDATVAVTLNVNGVPASHGPVPSYDGGKYTLKVAINPIWWKTAVPVSVTVTNAGSSSASGAGFFIDDVKIVCN